MDKTNIIKSVNSLLSCKNNFKLMYESTQQLYRVFSHIKSNDNLKNVMLAEDKAPSSVSATRCHLEMKRFAVFLRGIEKAIQLKQNQKKGMMQPIRILYAGTGPYGTLVVPLLLIHKPEEIQVDLIEKNPDTLEALKQTIETLELNRFVGDIYCQDATTFKVKKKYDIAVSETMKSCLKKEPQVSIMQNIIPQLTHDALFIPEEITINAALCNPRMEMDRFLSRLGISLPFKRIEMGNIFKVNRQNLNADVITKEIRLPDNRNDFHELKLFTTIKVFDKEILSENESSITRPVPIFDFNSRKEEISHIEFRYTPGTNSVIECIPLNQHKMVI